MKGDVMSRKTTTNYETLTNVVEYGKANVSSFPNNSAVKEILEALDSRVRAFPEKMAARIAAENAMQASLNTRTAAREDLRRYITQTTWIADSLHLDPVMQKPVNGSDQALINSGRGFVKDVGSDSDVFAKHGVGPGEVGAA